MHKRSACMVWAIIRPAMYKVRGGAGQAGRGELGGPPLSTYPTFIHENSHVPFEGLCVKAGRPMAANHVSKVYQEVIFRMKRAKL